MYGSKPGGVYQILKSEGLTQGRSADWHWDTAYSVTIKDKGKISPDIKKKMEKLGATLKESLNKKKVRNLIKTKS